MNTLALYQIADEYLQNLSVLESLELDDQTFADTLEGLSGEFDNKAVAVAQYAQNLLALAQSIKEAEAQMAERRKGLENKAERLKEYLLANMQRTGITKIDSPYFAISVRNNPESVIVDAEIMIPQDYWIFPDVPAPRVDKPKIKAALAAGIAINGVHLERKQSLQIK
jgi:hypothetical protein